MESQESSQNSFMKKNTYILLMILVGSFGAFAQTSTEKKTEIKTSAATVQREKFDPTRNAAADLQTAIAKATKENKRIILDVGGEWCIWCRWMDEYFIKNADLMKLRDENFVWLKINMSEENENKEFLAKYPVAAGYPHLYVLEKDGTFLHSQGTAELEEVKSYNKQRFTGFLTKWSPTKAAETK